MIILNSLSKPLNSLEYNCSHLPPDISLLENVLRLYGLQRSSDNVEVDSQTIHKRWKEKIGQRRSPSCPNSHSHPFWSMFTPNGFGIIESNQTPMQKLLNRQPAIWMHISTNLLGSQKIYTFNHLHTECQFKAHVRKGRINLYNNKQIVGVAETLPSNQLLAQHQCSVSRRNKMELTTFDNEPLFIHEENKITISAWNFHGLLFICQIKQLNSNDNAIMLDFYQRRLSWTKLSKTVFFEPKCFKKYDHYRVEGGKLKIDWINKSTVVQASTTDAEVSLLLLCSILFHVREILQK